MKPLVFANFLAPNMSATYTEVASRVGRAVGRPGRLILGTALTQLTDGTVDLAFLCGLPYVRLTRERPGRLRPLAAPLLVEARCRNRPVYFSDVIVRRDSPFRSFDELRGRSWAYNDEGSFSGCLLVRYHLVQMGETEAFFGRVVFTGRHQESIRQVLSGEVEASAIDCQVLGVERLRHPAVGEQTRVIANLGPSTVPPIVATARLSPNEQDQVREALCQLGDDPVSRRVLAAGLIQRFVPVDDAAYDDIRRKLAAVEGSVHHPNQLAGLGA